MKTAHLPSLIVGLLGSGCIILLTAASTQPSEIVTLADWPQSARNAFQASKDEHFQKTSSGSLDIFTSVDRKRSPITVVFRRDHPSPLAVFGVDNLDIYDSSGTIVSTSSVDIPGVIDRFAYASKRGDATTYYADQNLDGIIDVATTHRANRDVSVRVHIGNDWYEATGERYFEGEWFWKDNIVEAFKAKKVETKHYTRAVTPTGLRIVKFTGGVPSFVDAVQ